MHYFFFVVAVLWLLFLQVNRFASVTQIPARTLLSTGCTGVLVYERCYLQAFIQSF